MKLIFAALLALSFNASAFDMNFPSPGDFPTESGWAVAMTSMACGVDYSSVDGATGTMVPHDGRSVIYKVYVDGELVGKAWASSKWITAQKKCL